MLRHRVPRPVEPQRAALQKHGVALAAREQCPIPVFFSASASRVHRRAAAVAAPLIPAAAAALARIGATTGCVRR